MIRYAHSKVDANHRAIASALRELGCSVVSLAPLGKNAPDLLVGTQGFTFIFELKSGKNKQSEGQVAFAESWRGTPIYVVRSLEDALLVIRTKTKGE